jgi:hypothetical protein
MLTIILDSIYCCLEVLFIIISDLVSVYDLSSNNAAIELLNNDCDLNLVITFSLSLLLEYLHRSLLSDLEDWNITVKIGFSFYCLRSRFIDYMTL